MNKPICILVKKVPDDEIRLVENTYLKLPVEEAFRLIEEGYAVGYDPTNKEEFYPFLSKDYPMRSVLFENGIYTEEQLKPRIGVVSNIDGIGKKTIEKYNDLLFGKGDKTEVDGIIRTDEEE